VKGEVKDLWGPEVIAFSDHVIRKSHQNLFEYALDEALWFVPRDPPRNIEETMLKSINITEKDVERLFEDYVDHCFPSFYMTLNSFKSYMDKYGFETNDNKLILLFRSFNYMRTGFICFHELLLGLVIIEPETSHGLARARFIFRYYDQDASGCLNNEEFSRLVKDIHQKIKNPDEMNEKINTLKRVVGTKIQDGKEVITGEDFLKAIGDKRIRGTSNLCRSTKSIFTNILRTIAARSVYTVGTLVDLGSVIKHSTAPCVSCKSKDYEIATHAPLVLKDGRITDPLCIVDIDDNVEKLTSPVYSVDFVFNRNSAANVIIRLVHAFNLIKGTNKEPNGLLQDKPLILWDIILALYHDIDLLLMEEEKCPRINAPCYIIGDIHGNLEDLLSIEKSIFQRIPCVAANYLFLGDYVDRGQWSVECALLLFAFKCVAPNKVTLLRGNHEVRELQFNYTYRNECLRKYGQEIGLKIWEITNNIFDKLPVSAVVDDSIYCAHGGIPKSAKTINDINQVPKMLRDPENMSAIAWEILWSDPCHPRQFYEVANVTQQDPKDNFIFNSKRGTAFLFNEKAAKEFLKQNKLTHIVRGHEVPQRGWQVSFFYFFIFLFLFFLINFFLNSTVSFWTSLLHNILLFALLWQQQRMCRRSGR